jgi:hypothetical protein
MTDSLAAIVSRRDLRSEFVANDNCRGNGDSRRIGLLNAATGPRHQYDRDGKGLHISMLRKTATATHKAARDWGADHLSAYAPCSLYTFYAGFVERLVFTASRA